MNRSDAPPTGPTNARRTNAGSSRRAWVMLLALVAVFLAADLGTKALAFEHVADAPVTVERERVLLVLENDPRMLQALIPRHDPVVVLPHLLEFKLVLNAGAVFGAGAGLRWFFVGFTGVALGFAIYIFAAWIDRRAWLAQTAIALVIAGGIGNLYDRLAFACVRDFIHPLPGVMLPFGLSYPGGGRDLWPYVSNVADAFLLIGIGVLVVRLWRAETPPPAEHPKSDEPTPTPTARNR